MVSIDYLLKAESTSKICMRNAPVVDEQDVKSVHKKREEANKLSFGPEIPWVGCGKMGPWWRLADGDELALLVSQKSLNLIENCDLPHPQNTCSNRDPYAYVGSLGRDSNFTSSLHLKAQVVNRRGDLISGSGCGVQHSSFQEQNRENLDHRETIEAHISESDPSKAQLLEALSSCQTRAREAEKLVDQATGEKEHIITLFFQQASQLYACKQWFQILQLENLHILAKNKEKNKSYLPLLDMYPVDFPWLDRKTRKIHEMKRSRPARRTRIRSEDGGLSCDDISKLGVAFAIGLGMLLGWSIGWILPFF